MYDGVAYTDGSEECEGSQWVVKPAEGDNCLGSCLVADFGDSRSARQLITELFSPSVGHKLQ